MFVACAVIPFISYSVGLPGCIAADLKTNNHVKSGSEQGDVLPAYERRLPGLEGECSERKMFRRQVPCS